MIQLFLITLFLTFILTRVLTMLLHDNDGYILGFEKSKTPTGLIRRKTGLDFHHLHFGLVILIVVIPLLFWEGIDEPQVLFLAMGISLVADQLELFIRDSKDEYFRLRSWVYALIFHALIALIAILGWMQGYY